MAVRYKIKIRKIMPYILCFIVTAVITLLVNRFVISSVKVSGDSMVPTFQNNERLLMYKLTIDPERNDIVVCKNNVSGTGYIIKRCIGVEGDTIIIDYINSKVYVNGEELNEDYLSENYMFEVNDHGEKLADGVYKYTVPKECIFVLGDNRNSSLDSRDAMVGYIGLSDISGTVIFDVSDWSFI